MKLLLLANIDVQKLNILNFFQIKISMNVIYLFKRKYLNKQGN